MFRHFGHKTEFGRDKPFVTVQIEMQMSAILPHPGNGVQRRSAL